MKVVSGGCLDRIHHLLYQPPNSLCPSPHFKTQSHSTIKPTHLIYTTSHSANPSRTKPVMVINARFPSAIGQDLASPGQSSPWSNKTPKGLPGAAHASPIEKSGFVTVVIAAQTNQDCSVSSAS
ncbi:hypothetical protein JTE90_016706 [Oedothorax gibbosus]|uniref:Uncharacterized protein n=1 Tax=Oedothorax gibbosus TaxID=931172 RepID=A0AAV6V361_9ARAC|nr:hypothetical protein JTE90_016706 [Oedothorax gibbosus]